LVPARGKDHCKFGSIDWGKANAVEAVGQVNLEHVDRAPPGISQENVTKETFESSTELHGFQRGERNGVGILIIETKITNDAGSPIVLGDYTKWGNAQVGEVLGHRVRQNCPEPFVDKVNHFFR
jgi:hypothetical protein